MAESEQREHWSSSIGFVLAAVGSAVGLGNVWKFPYITGEYGGGAFVLLYLVCIIAIGVPLLIAEMMIGRHTQRGPVGAFIDLAGRARGGTSWKVAGYFAILVSFGLLSFYSVVGGWAFAYSFKAVSGEILVGTPGDIRDIFKFYTTDPVWSTVSHAAFMAATISIVYGGVTDGIEKAARFLMPVFGLLLGGLLIYSLSTPGAGQAIEFMFYPDWERLFSSPNAVMEALGHAFFTLSLGMGAMLVYGSYLSGRDSLVKTSLAVAFFDTLVALSAGLVLFGIIFSSNGDPASGPGLVFKTMPVLFAEITGGYYIAVAFFALLSFAALTSGMSLLEVCVSFFIEETDMTRGSASILFGTAIFVCGLPSVFSFNLIHDYQVLFYGKCYTFFDLINYLISNWALIIGGLVVAIFVGWSVPEETWYSEIEGDTVGEAVFDVWKWLVRIVAPVAIILVMLNTAGLFATGQDGEKQTEETAEQKVCWNPKQPQDSPGSGDSSGETPGDKEAAASSNGDNQADSGASEDE
jgi:NSS family neurotransmitter:Na+ symporter